MRLRTIISVICLLYMHHAFMMQDKQIASLPNPYEVQDLLLLDYKNYLKNQLEVYKTGSIDLAKLQNQQNDMLAIGCSFSSILGDISDDDGNTFAHIAVLKKDIEQLKDLLHVQARLLYCTNIAFQRPLDVFIQHISPCHSMDVVEKDILRTIINKMPITTIRQAHEARKILSLKLQYVRHNHKFDVSDRLLKRLLRSSLPSSTEDLDQMLSSYYQQTIDKADGSTFTHVFIDQGRCEELFELMKQGRSSFIQNKAGLTPIDLALQKFRHFTQDKTLIDSNDESFIRARCCLSMLINHLKYVLKDSNIIPCCEKHSISTPIDV